MSATLRDWAELVRLPAAVTVPGDALVGLAAAGGPVRPRSALLPLASVSMYWAGMALNDWADRDLDAVERPERPVPSGRISPRQALGAAAALTAASVGLAAAASGRRGAGTAVVLAAAVWSYDLVAKPRAWAPVSMSLTRALDVALGATGAAAPAAAGRSLPPALLPALTTGLHTLAVTDLSRGEVHGAPSAQASRAGATTVLAAAAVVPVLLGRLTSRTTAPARTGAVLLEVLVGAAALTAHTVPLLRAQARAGRTGTGPDARHATITGIKAFLPLQAALLSALGRPVQAVSLVGAGTLVSRLLRGGPTT
ncbi:SCO3242 family prenyltransferase [Aquipuribacter sp. MA13-6]|uniref:SCO3242 family prenyltransferase n=1 Tax=unclassified Aquipuribacter TaxID=2635084 RepID=UPI003EE87944